MAITLSEIKTQIWELLDDPNGDLLDTSVLTDLINASGRRWHSMIVQLSPELFETTETITPDDGSDFALAANHYKTLGVRYIDNSGESVHLKRVQYQERHRYEESGTATQARGYYLSGENLYLVPAPATGSNTYKHDYLRGWTTLSNPSDKVGGLATNTVLDHYIDWIVYDVVIKGRLKEESELDGFRAERDGIEAGIKAAIFDREAAAPARIADVRPRSLPDEDFWSNR